MKHLRMSPLPLGNYTRLLCVSVCVCVYIYTLSKILSPLRGFYRETIRHQQVHAQDCVKGLDTQRCNCYQNMSGWTRAPVTQGTFELDLLGNTSPQGVCISLLLQSNWLNPTAAVALTLPLTLTFYDLKHTGLVGGAKRPGTKCVLRDFGSRNPILGLLSPCVFFILFNIYCALHKKTSSLEKKKKDFSCSSQV